MKRASAILCLLGLLVLSVPLGAEEPPMEYRAFLPVVGKSAVSPSPPPVTDLCNPSAEWGEMCWTFSYPGSGNILCNCDGEDCPPATDGDCIFRYGGWHDITETGQSADFWMDNGLVYHLSLQRLIWSTEWPFREYDTFDLYLVVPGGYHHQLMSWTNLDESSAWQTEEISISPGTTGYHSLLFVAITDYEKDDVFPGVTNFYIDNIRLAEWGDCKECVVCQVQDEPPVTFCDQGAGDECDGCCPSGDDCAGLDPQCPALPPPHFYREVDRYCECAE